MNGFDLTSNQQLWKQCFSDSHVGFVQFSFSPVSQNQQVDAVVSINNTVLYGISTSSGTIGWKTNNVQNFGSIWITQEADFAIVDLLTELIELDAQTGTPTGREYSLINTSYPSVFANMEDKMAIQEIPSDSHQFFQEYDLTSFSAVASCNVSLGSLGQYFLSNGNVLFISDSFFGSLDLSSCSLSWKNSSLQTLNFVTDGNNYIALRNNNGQSWVEQGSISSGPFAIYSVPSSSFYMVADPNYGFYAVGFKRFNVLSVYYKGTLKGSLEKVSSAVAKCTSSTECYLVSEDPTGKTTSYHYQL